MITVLYYHPWYKKLSPYTCKYPDSENGMSKMLWCCMSYPIRTLFWNVLLCSSLRDLLYTRLLARAEAYNYSVSNHCVGAMK